jgi:hypothetical protein
MRERGGEVGMKRSDSKDARERNEEVSAVRSSVRGLQALFCGGGPSRPKDGPSREEMFGSMADGGDDGAPGTTCVGDGLVFWCVAEKERQRGSVELMRGREVKSKGGQELKYETISQEEFSRGGAPGGKCSRIESNGYHDHGRG